MALESRVANLNCRCSVKVHNSSETDSSKSFVLLGAEL